METLTTLARFQTLDAGDLLLTGTPVGTAITPARRGIANPQQIKWTTFLDGQQEPKYLQDGDVMEATVATDDGAIDLGPQRNVVVYA